MSGQLLNCYLRSRKTGEIVCIDRDERGNRRRRTTQAEYVAYFRDVTRTFARVLREDGRVRSIKVEGDWWRASYGDWMARDQAVQRYRQHGVTAYEADLNPVRRFCVDHDIRPAKPRRIYLDIETDSRLPFSRKEEMRILCWTLATDDESIDPLMGVLEGDSDDDEQTLLRALYGALDSYDQVVAWNGDGFDFEVMKARKSAVGIRWEVDDRQWLWIDQMELFRKSNIMGAESGDEKQSTALDAVATSLLKIGKYNFDASKTWEAWAQGIDCRTGRAFDVRDCVGPWFDALPMDCRACRACLVRYCAQDTRLLPKIERKTGFLVLNQTVCEVTGAFPDSMGVKPMVQVENLLLRLGLREGYRFATKIKRDVKKKADKFKGAYVMAPTERGIVKDVHVVDFASLYPSIICTWNMSPETIRPGPGPGIAEVPGTGIFFDQTIPGILPVAVAELLRLRKHWSDLEGTLPPGTVEAKDAGRRSKAYKTLANSFYGVIGSMLGRFYVREVAESVTQAGVWLCKQTIQQVEQHGYIPIGADTDSVMARHCTREQIRALVGWLNQEFYPGQLKQLGCQRNTISLAAEKGWSRVVFPEGKKRYCAALSYFKGADANENSKPEIKGLEYRRGDSARLARRMQEEVVNLLVGYKCQPSDDPRDYLPIIDRYRKAILEDPLNIDDVAVSKRLSRGIDDYQVKDKLDGTPGNEPIHVRIAKILLERGQDMREGSRVRYVVVDGSVQPKKAMPADDWCGECDRHDFWESFVWPPTQRLISAAFPTFDWSTYDRTRPFGDRQRVMIAREGIDGKIHIRAAKRGKRRPEGNLELPWGNVPVLPSEILRPSTRRGPIVGDDDI